MNKFCYQFSLFLALFLLCLSSEAKSKKDMANSSVKFKTIEWTELIPKEDLNILLNPPNYVTNVKDGSLEDQISNKLQQSLNAANDDSYQQALVSTKVVPNIHNQSVRIPGFIVPVSFGDGQVVTQFFLVPYFGACIHVPPPPPNQIILVDYPKGLKIDVLHEPFWIYGVLKTTLTENNIATSAYSLEMSKYEAYKEG